MMSSQFPTSVRNQRNGEGHDPFASPSVYYGEDADAKRDPYSRRFTFSGAYATRDTVEQPKRRTSHDVIGSTGRKFIIEVDATLKNLLEREDTDENMQITIDDRGPKVNLVLSLFLFTADIDILFFIGSISRYCIVSWLQKVRSTRTLCTFKPPTGTRLGPRFWKKAHCAR
jgi:hypothetical protein